LVRTNDANMEEAGILEKITRSGFCYPALNQVPFRARFGAFYPQPAHKSAPRAAWATHPGHCSPASRLPPHQRGEVLCRLSPAGYCLPPTAQLPITERGPISTSEPSISLCAEPGDSCGQIHPFLPTRRRSPVDRSLVAKALNPSLFRHACRMATSRNSCSLLDFPEFAQAVGYGVPGTPRSNMH
jgi:hypothetical protein